MALGLRAVRRPLLLQRAHLPDRPERRRLSTRQVDRVSIALLVAAGSSTTGSAALDAERDRAGRGAARRCVASPRRARPQLFAPRAAYLQVGAMLGTIMVGERLLRDHPGALGADPREAGGPRARPAPALRGKQRSVHNNYLTLPVLFAMLAQPLPVHVRARTRWLVLVALMVIGAWIRHFFNLRHGGRNVWWIPVTAALGIAAVAVAIRPTGGSGGTAVAAGRCRSRRRRRSSSSAASPCHSMHPTQRSPRAPLGIVLRHAAANRGAGAAIEQHGGRLTADAARERDAHDAGRARRRSAPGSARARDQVGSRDAGDRRRRISRFVARLEEEHAPQTVAAFRRLLPLESQIIHVRWSGEAGWIPFGDLDLGLGPENATCYPGPGELIFYPGRRQRDGAPARVRLRRVREQGGRARGQPLRDDRRGRRAAARARPQGPLGRRAADALSRKLSRQETAPHPSLGGAKVVRPPPASSVSRENARVCDGSVPEPGLLVHSRREPSSAPVSTSTASSMSSSAQSSSGEWLMPPFRLRTKSIARRTPAAASTPAS